MKGDLAENPLNSLPVVHGRGGDLSLPLSSLFLCFPRDVWDWRWRRAGGRGRDMGWDGGCAGDSDRGLRETHRLLPPKFRNKFHGRRRRERRPSLILKASLSLSLSLNLAISDVEGRRRRDSSFLSLFAVHMALRLRLLHRRCWR